MASESEYWSARAKERTDEAAQQGKKFVPPSLAQMYPSQQAERDEAARIHKEQLAQMNEARRARGVFVEPSWADVWKHDEVKTDGQ